MGILEYWQGLFPFQKYFPSPFPTKYLHVPCRSFQDMSMKVRNLFFFLNYNLKHLCEDSAEVYSVKHYVICNHSFWVQGLRLPFLYRTHIAVCRDVRDVSLVPSFVVAVKFLPQLPSCSSILLHTWTASISSFSSFKAYRRSEMIVISPFLFFHNPYHFYLLFYVVRDFPSWRESKRSLSILVWEDRTR